MATIHARRFWNRTPFRLVKGVTYRVTASGTWFDRQTPCPATGYTDPKLRWFEGIRREPDAKWFSLIGRIDKKRRTQFDIGALLERDEPLQATESGELFVFANDVWFMYFNNRGSIELQLDELPPTREATSA